MANLHDLGNSCQIDFFEEILLVKRPTQADVARLAGVSRATVSNVMNGRIDSKIPVSEETRQRVLDAIAELDYTPDIRAQSLRSGTTKSPACCCRSTKIPSSGKF